MDGFGERRDQLEELFALLVDAVDTLPRRDENLIALRERTAEREHVHATPLDRRLEHRLRLALLHLEAHDLPTVVTDHELLLLLLAHRKQLHRVPVRDRAHLFRSGRRAQNLRAVPAGDASGGSRLAPGSGRGARGRAPWRSRRCAKRGSSGPEPGQNPMSGIPTCRKIRVRARGCFLRGQNIYASVRGPGACSTPPMADMWSRMLDESGLGELAMESGLPLPSASRAALCFRGCASRDAPLCHTRAQAALRRPLPTRSFSARRSAGSMMPTTGILRARCRRTTTRLSSTMIGAQRSRAARARACRGRLTRGAFVPHYTARARRSAPNAR